jgi:hypothetical protein
MIRQRLLYELKLNELVKSFRAIEELPSPTHLAPASDEEERAIEAVRTRLLDDLTKLDGRLHSALQSSAMERRIYLVGLVVVVLTFCSALILLMRTTDVSVWLTGPAAIFGSSGCVWYVLQRLREFRKDEAKLQVEFSVEKYRLEVDACQNATCLQRIAKRIRQVLEALQK